MSSPPPPPSPTPRQLSLLLRARTLPPPLPLRNLDLFALSRAIAHFVRPIQLNANRGVKSPTKKMLFHRPCAYCETALQSYTCFCTGPTLTSYRSCCFTPTLTPRLPLRYTGVAVLHLLLHRPCTHLVPALLSYTCFGSCLCIGAEPTLYRRGTFFSSRCHRHGVVCTGSVTICIMLL